MEKSEERQDTVDSSENDAKITFLPHEDKKAAYKINRKLEKAIAKDEADLKKVKIFLYCETLF